MLTQVDNKLDYQIEVQMKTLPAEPWRWVTRDGEELLPSEMVTRHLFHTLRMIWNNHCPPHAQVGKVRLYAFPAKYTPEYFRQAVVEITRELRTRKRIPDYMQQELDEMWAYLNNRIENGESFMEIHDGQ